MESSEEAYGWVDISCYGGGPSLFHLRAAFLRMCSQEDFLDLENEEYVVFYLGRAQPPPSSSFYGVSAIEEFWSTGEKLCSLEPTRLLSQ